MRAWSSAVDFFSPEDHGHANAEDARNNVIRAVLTTRPQLSWFGRLTNLTVLSSFVIRLSEMGEGLYRGVVSFEKEIPPETIAAEKERSNALELTMAQASDPDARRVNIDIGYMDLDKVGH